MNGDLHIPEGLGSILKSIDAVTQKGVEVGAPADIQAHLSTLMRMAAFSLAALAPLPKCQLGSPHKDIQTSCDPSGNLRLECLHSPTHCWDLNGHRCSC